MIQVKLIILLSFFTAMSLILDNVVLAERTGGVDVEPLVYAATMKMVRTWKLSKLGSIVIGREANATLLHVYH